MTDTCARGIDTVLIIQVRKETRSRIGSVAVLEGFAVQINLHLRSRRVCQSDGIGTANGKVLEVAHGLRQFHRCGVERNGVIDDTTVAIVITDIFRNHKGILESSLRYLRGTRENSVRVIVVRHHFRLSARVVVVARRDRLHLVIDGNINTSVEVFHYQTVLVDNLTLYLLNTQRIERIHLCLRVHEIVSRVVQTDSRVTQQHVRHFVAIATEVVFTYTHSLTDGHVVMEHIRVTEQFGRNLAVQFGVRTGIYGSRSSQHAYGSTHRVQYCRFARGAFARVAMGETTGGEQPERVVLVGHVLDIFDIKNGLVGNSVITSVTGVIEEQHAVLEQVGQAVLG